MKALIEMPVYGTDENKEFQKEIVERLERRLYLATLVAKKAKAMEAEG